jgi:hypothetical protein
MGPTRRDEKDPLAGEVYYLSNTENEKLSLRVRRRKLAYEAVVRKI